MALALALSCSARSQMTPESPRHDAAAASPTATLTLRIEVVGAAVAVGEPVTLRATYEATAPVTIFHRLLMGWAPDQLELHYVGPGGAITAERLIMSLPKKLGVAARDFVTVAPERPLSFSFPTWTPTPLQAGAWTVRARHVPAAEHYLDDAGVRHDVDAWPEPLTSNEVGFEVVDR